MYFKREVLSKLIRKNNFFQGCQNPLAMSLTRVSFLKIFSFAKDTVLLRPQAAASKTVFASRNNMSTSVVLNPKNICDNLFSPQGEIISANLCETKVSA